MAHFTQESEAGARRDHLAHDLETLVDFLAPFVGGDYEYPDGSTRVNEVVIWYDQDVVSAILDDADPRDFITCVHMGGLKSADQVLKRILQLLNSHGVLPGDLVRLYHGRLNFLHAPAPSYPSDVAA